jgi:glycosyltransferase involved in cell wall biosynthesis
MKILQLCKKFPFPLKDGESIAINNLSKALVEAGCQVDLLAMNTTRHPSSYSADHPDLAHYTNVSDVEVDNRLKPLDALTNLIKGSSYHISRFESEDFHKRLESVLRENEYDVIQLETIYLTPYVDTIRKHSNALVAMRSHNVEHEIWDRIADNTSFFPKKWYLRILTEQLKGYEVEHLNEYDYLIAISDCDLEKYKGMGYRNGAMSSPVGLRLDKYRPSSACQERSISFIGSLDWMPNQEGLQWFLDEVMPNLNEVELHVAGRNTPDHIKGLSIPYVHIHGEVENALAFIDQHDIMVVPLLSGSGIRVKILEGMAMGKVVVTTSKGMEGIGARNGMEVLVADDAETFAKRVQWAVDHPEEVRDMGQRAREFVRHYYDAGHLARNLIHAYDKALSSDYSKT